VRRDVTRDVHGDVRQDVRREGQRVQGFFVSSDGMLCTVLPQARVGDRVFVGDDADATPGVVAMIADDGLALVTVPTSVDRPRAALGVADDDAVAGRWLTGLAMDERGVVQGFLGDTIKRQPGRWQVLLPLPSGAPILDERAAVVAVAVGAHLGGVVDALPVALLRALAARWRSRDEPRGRGPPAPAPSATAGDQRP
jgi:hypothetical protein